jgi:hypothetical protein
MFHPSEELIANLDCVGAEGRIIRPFRGHETMVRREGGIFVEAEVDLPAIDLDLPEFALTTEERFGEVSHR